MGQAMRSVSQNPFGTVLPSDVLGAAVDGFNDIVMVTESDPVDEPGPRVLFVNPAFEKITGYRPEEILGRSPRFMQGAGTSADEIQRIDAALSARRPIRAELLNYKRDGTAFWLEIEASITRSPSTGTEFFVFIERDITERKIHEAGEREQERAIATLFSNLPGMA
jgi:PAS domain S-box-containing protein